VRAPSVTEAFFQHEQKHQKQPVFRRGQGSAALSFLVPRGQRQRAGGRLARDLGAVPFHAWRPGWDRGGTPAPVRYLFQALDTARALRRLRPSAVYVQVPPVFALVQAWWYGVRTGAPVAADNHSSFLDGKWRLFHWLQRPLARRIRLNLAHNEATWKCCAAGAGTRRCC
jgi:hypothetical protein